MSRSLSACLASVLTLASLTACGGPDADPEQALKLVCGEDADIRTGEPEDDDPDDLVSGVSRSCDIVPEGSATALVYTRNGLDTIEGEAMEFESGNGDVPVWAFLETEDDGGGIGITVYPPAAEDADPAVLEPLADEGWTLSSD